MDEHRDNKLVPISIKKAKRRNYAKKVQHEWREEEIDRLIAAIKVRRSLWDVGLQEYKLPKTDTWQEVADFIGNITVDEAKAKWSNLRITFKTNLAKYRSKKSGQTTGEPVAIHWRFFKSMMFLEANDVQQSDESSTSFATTSLPHANTDASVLNDFSVTPSQSTYGVVVGQKRKRNATPRSTGMPSPTPSNNSLKEHVLGSKKALDDYGIFGEYIAGELRSLSTDRAIYVKRELNRSLLRLMDSEQPPQPPSLETQKQNIFRLRNS